MSIKPVLVPDHDAAELRGLMDRFADASTGPTKKQLNESRAAVTAAQGVAEEQLDELSVHKMLKYSAAAEKDRDALNQKWDDRTASEKEKERVLRHEKGEQRAADKIKQKTGKLPVQIGKLDRLKHAITREGVTEGTESEQEELAKKIRELLAAGKDREANHLRHKLNNLRDRERDKHDRQQGVAEGLFGDKAGKEINHDAIGKLSDEELQRAYKFSNSFNIDPEHAATSKALRAEIKKRKEQGVAEGNPDVMRHTGDKTVKVVKRRGKPIGEIGIDSGPEGNGDYYVKLYDGSYDAAGFSTAEEALAELKYAVKQMAEGSLTEFAPPDSGDGGGDDDGFDEDTLRKLAAQWFAGDEDPQVERLLAAAGWEIGQDEGYDDEPGVFVVMSGDDNGRSYMSWPAEELRSSMSEGPETGIGSKLPKSDIETFGLQKGRPYKLNPPQDWKPGDRKRAVQQLIPTQDKKDHIRSRLGKHVAPVLPEQDAAERYKDTSGTFVDRIVGEILNYQSLNNTNPKFSDLSSAVKSKLKSLGEIKAKQIYQQALKQSAELSGQQDVAEGSENNPVVNVITRRIMLQRTDLLSKYGPEKVGQAIDEVADFVGDVEEIGSSDVSGWVRHVEQMLGNRESDVAEQQVDELSPKTLGSYIKKSSADAAERQGEVSGRNQFGKGAEFAVKAFYGDRIQPNPTRTDPKIAKRQAGVDQAVDRLTAEDVAEGIDPVEQLRADIRRFSR